MGGKLMYNLCVLLVFESFSNSVLEKSIDFKEFENFAGIYSAIYKIKRNSINVTWFASYKFYCSYTVYI